MYYLLYQWLLVHRPVALACFGTAPSLGLDGLYGAFRAGCPSCLFKSRAAPQPAFSWPSPRGETPFSAALALDSLCSGLRHKEVSPRGGLPGSAPTTIGAGAPISTGVEIHCGSPDLQQTCLGRCSFRHLVLYIYAEADSLDSFR